LVGSFPGLDIGNHSVLRIASTSAARLTNLVAVTRILRRRKKTKVDMPKQDAEQLAPSRLGEHLAAIRTARGLSLRRVEELSNKQVSNPYLNQIERGKIRQPSPNILYALSEIYQASYEQLMELAGYFNPTSDPAARHGKLATLSEMNLNEAEEQVLAKYLQFLREQQPRI